MRGDESETQTSSVAYASRGRSYHTEEETATRTAQAMVAWRRCNHRAKETVTRFAKVRVMARTDSNRM
jgi:hypothetical protein